MPCSTERPSSPTTLIARAPTSPTSGKTFGDYFVSKHNANRAKNERTRQQLLRELTTTESDGFTPPSRNGLGD